MPNINKILFFPFFNLGTKYKKKNKIMHITGPREPNKIKKINETIKLIIPKITSILLIPDLKNKKEQIHKGKMQYPKERVLTSVKPLIIM